MKKQILNTILCCLLVGNILAQQTPAPKQKTAFSIEGATAHLGNGEVIKNSLIIFDQGKITFVGSAKMKIARQGTVINASGKHLYPGFIATNATLGLAEIDAVRATIDVDETGSMLPHIRSLIAINTESRIIETMRPNGVLMAESAPRGGTISGTASVIQLDAWNWEDAAINIDNGIHMNWPSSFKSGRWWLGEDPTLKPDKNYAKNSKKISDYFINAKLYLEGNKLEMNVPYESMKGLFDGTQKLYIHVSGVREITDAVKKMQKIGVKNIVLVGAYEADKVADLLVKNEIPVVVNRAHRVPENEDDDYDLPYRNAGVLMEKGVTVSVGMQGGRMERMNTRNLPFYAGTYAAYGVGTEKAIQMITLNAAKILGVDEIVGSIEVGKDATLFISKGDALDMATNRVEKAFIQGRNISLESHQTELYKRYSNKYKTQK